MTEIAYELPKTVVDNAIYVQIYSRVHRRRSVVLILRTATRKFFGHHPSRPPATTTQPTDHPNQNHRLTSDGNILFDRNPLRITKNRCRYVQIYTRVHRHGSVMLILRAATRNIFGHHPSPPPATTTQPTNHPSQDHRLTSDDNILFDRKILRVTKHRCR